MTGNKPTQHLLKKKWDERIIWLRSLIAGDSRQQILISISALAGSGLIAVALRFLGGIIQGRFVGPETLGFYTKFTILPGFLFFLHLGVFTSLARQYPYYIGKGKKDYALNYAANAQGWTLVLCVFHFIAFLIPSIYALFNGDWRSALGWGVQSVLSTTSLYMFYLASTYRNSSEFVVWSRATIISSIVSFLLLPLVAIYQFAGLCTRYSVPNVVSMLYAHWRRPLKIRPKLELDVLRRMIAFGLPLMVFAYISHQLTDAITRSFILKQLGEKALGVYAYSAMLCLALTTVSSSISQVFNPRLAMRYGETEKSMSASFFFSIKCSLVGVVVMLPLVGMTWWAIDPLVRWFLPKYIDCIPITRWLCWLSLIPVIDLPKQLLMVAKQTRAIAASVLTGFFVLTVGLGVLVAADSNISLHSIVIVIVVSKLVTVLISSMFAWTLAAKESNKKESTRV